MEKKTIIDNPFFGFTVGFLLFLIGLTFFMSCSEPPTPPVIETKEQRDSLTKAFKDSLDSLPVTNIETEMKAKQVFDSLKK